MKMQKQNIYMASKVNVKEIIYKDNKLYIYLFVHNREMCIFTYPNNINEVFSG